MAVVDDDRLVARSEEAVWDVVVAWMRDGAAGRWRDVVSLIRFQLMYRRDRVVDTVREEDREWMACVKRIGSGWRVWWRKRGGPRRRGGRVRCSNPSCGGFLAAWR